MHQSAGSHRAISFNILKATVFDDRRVELHYRPTCLSSIYEINARLLEVLALFMNHDNNRSNLA